MGYESYMASIGIFAGTFAPQNWAFCQGQTIAIQSNTALFSLLGTTYGGDGQSTFKLPDLRGRVLVGVGAGPGLPSYSLGQMSGTPTTTLTVANMPAHTHATGAQIISSPATKITGSIDIKVSDNPGDSRVADMKGLGLYAVDKSGDIILVYDNDPVYSGKKISGVEFSLENPAHNITLPAGNTGVSGANQPLSVMQPYLALNFCICTQGIYPSRN